MQTKITAIKDKDTMNMLTNNEKYRYYVSGATEIIIPNNNFIPHIALGKIYSVSDDMLTCISTLVPKVINLQMDIGKKYALPNLNSNFSDMDNVEAPNIYFNMPNTSTLKAYVEAGGIFIGFTIPRGDSGLFISKPFKDFVMQIYTIEEKISNAKWGNFSGLK